ncbi:TCR/Tet family MFS transporter [Tropicimonas isoalkanivorans]|uniref:MFS transporter, DHA1 family, tetracycline resistance protein n=1 Tax=Tropicimonas isoalkanivorans TaxID=441112 RepID=A0A1I1IHD2_9RHOB|nr:TCR/Tet family MFS transporter [Tropicimonas isoalkanivorans]SFC35684.1 MFS transporter, DHA1 family, tetracycline resistance protein [Tropicimonas isoalkanivorans]
MPTDHRDAAPTDPEGSPSGRAPPLPPVSRDSRLPLVFILATLVIDAMGIGLILPVMPDLIRDVEGATLAEAAVWGGILATGYAVMQFLFGPILGALSDAHGRRPVLLASLAVMAVDYLVMAVTGSIWMLLAARVFGGVLAATHATAMAFVADISRPQEKAARFALTHAAYGVGFVLGPVLGGALGVFGPRAPFYAAAALAVANLVLGLVVLPETVTRPLRRPFSWRRANPFGAIAHVGSLPGVGRLMAVLAIYEFALYVYPAIWAYFTPLRFGWDTPMVGLSLALFGIGFTIVQAGLIRPILRRLGEDGTILFGLCAEVVILTTLGLVTSGTFGLILTPISAIGSVAVPALQGLMSQRVSADAQGELQGVVTSTISLATVLAPLLMTQVFYLTTREGASFHHPGATFLLAAALMVGGVLLYVGGPRGRAAPG